jgi:hypothetical protein
MLVKKMFLGILLLSAITPCYEIPDENEEIARTCRINVKLQVIPDASMQNRTGRALVTTTVTDDEGNPYGGERVTLSANAGTFVCGLPKDTVPATETAVSPADCFLTGYDGIARLYLVNIPLNSPIRVTASYNCNDSRISSSATMSISRGVVNKSNKSNKSRSKRVVPPRTAPDKASLEDF